MPLRTTAIDLARYRVATLEKGLQILELLERASKPLSIQEIARATAIQRVAVFRLLCTLERGGYVQRLESKKYRSTMRRRRILIGYCAPLTGSSFRRALAASIQRAARDSNVDLLAIDNREDDSQEGLRSAQVLVDARVDLAMVFEPLQSIGVVVADRFFRAGIPFISIEVPLPGGVYFGANNYQAGKLAGEVLAGFAAEHWKGRFDRVLLVESSAVGGNVQARLTGVLVGLREKLGAVDESKVVHLDGRSHFETSREVVGTLLAGLPKGAHLLISGFNDQTALGALQAVRAAQRERDVAIVGQNACEEGREEIRNPASRFIASIAYFPERYGSRLIRLSQSILNREPVPPAVYTEHVVLDRANIDEYYGTPLAGAG